MNDRGWLNERPEPIVQQAMATEAGIERRRAALAGEPHPLDCRCRECICDCGEHEALILEPDMDLALDPLRDFSAEDEKW